MIYLLQSFTLLTAASSLIYYLKYSNINLLYKQTIQEIKDLKVKIEHYYNEKIELIGKIEFLNANIQANQKAQEESLKNSKSILYELTNSVTNQLIEIHKKEVNDAKKSSEETIVKQTEGFNKELEKVASLVNMLTKDFSDSKKIVTNLQSALLSPTSSGAFAEMTLENILKKSSLRPNIDFQMQYSFNNEVNNKLRPDAVVFLPEDNILVIDAKASQFLVMPEKNEELAKTMNLHLKNLLSKDYTSELAKSLQANRKIRKVTTIMFLATDHAITKIQEADKSFLDKAWANNIYPAGPTGLINILSMANIHICEQTRAENYENIINEFSILLNSLNIISEH
ncbi:MAG: DNA recombination protein RmuC, partial [Rickettsiaceae bacterium]|nr:DNA recombination protein RmuC [Rickettsiaceae bacterium]